MLLVIMNNWHVKKPLALHLLNYINFISIYILYDNDTQRASVSQKRLEILCKEAADNLSTTCFYTLPIQKKKKKKQNNKNIWI